MQFNFTSTESSVSFPSKPPAATKKKIVNEKVVSLTLYTVNKVPIFPSPAGMSLTKLSLVRKNLIIPGLGEFG
jgi:hypothetical protein